jgi:glycosyltransferase involved in cell wall biosynthesis
MEIIIDASGVGIGGIGVFLEEVVKNWPAKDDLLVIGVTESRARNLHRAQNGGLKIITVSENRFLGLLMSIFAAYRNYGSNTKILSMSPSLTSLAFRKKDTVIIHDFMFLDAPQFVPRINRIYRKASNTISLKKSKKFIFVSATTASRYLQMRNRDFKEFTIISPTCGLKEITKAIPILNDALKNERKIVVVPAHSANKGVNHIKKSLPYFDEEILIVLLTGNKRLQANMQSQDKIMRLGWISDEEYSWLLRSASCLAFLSDYEGFGIPIIEAMQVGLPLVISSDPALMETAKEYGLVVQSNSPIEVGHAINLISRSGKKTAVQPKKSWTQVTLQIARYISK